MSELIKKTRIYTEAVNHMDLETISNLFADKMIFTDPSVTNLTPKPAIMDFFRLTFEQTQGSLQFKIIDIFEQTNMTILEFEINIGENTYNGVDIFEWEDGLIVSLRGYVNGLGSS
ncbi:MAG: nuclear transport factor 2 family protein [Candidatus Thiodiazotropha sp.]